MSNFEKHCQEELSRAGLFDKDSDYHGMLGHAIMRLAKTHAKEGHSGFSASIVREVFYRLQKWETLTPITSDRKEWMLVSKGMWQNRRNPAMFSNNGGKTHYSVDDKNRRKIRSRKPARKEE